ncbi:MAG TPA: LysR family transcriptional regulator [Terriglobales bacterium]|nr:LysR family transcriptional regulator [Terriglobales bacterium]
MPQQEQGTLTWAERMELRHLQVLVAVAEEGRLHKAAARLRRTTPAVSVAIRKLEEEAGTPLFERSKRHKLYLTAAGEELVNYAKRLLALSNEARAAVAELRSAKGEHTKSMGHGK